MQPVELVVRLNAAGKVEVTGPIEQRLLCYGLLEVARDVIGAYTPAEQRIVPPPPGALSIIKGNGNVG
jgi:hypothetical protein